MVNKNKQEAIKLGNKFFEGKVCKRCGNTQKYTCSSSCVYCSYVRTVNRDPAVGKRYRQSEKGKARWKRHKKTDAYRSVQNRYKRKDYKNNPEKYKKWHKDDYERRKDGLIRETHLKQKYNLTLEEYNKMFETQNGTCYICQSSNNDKRQKNLCVDHCHETGKIRKLLCNRCNHGLGHARENIEILENMIKYIKEHKDASALN